MTSFQQMISELANNIYEHESTRAEKYSKNELTAIIQSNYNRYRQGESLLDNMYDPRRSEILNLVEDVFLGREKNLIGDSTEVSTVNKPGRKNVFQVGRFYFFEKDQSYEE